MMALAEKQVDPAQTRQIIVHTGQKLGYVDAFNAVRNKGGLPSNALHDNILLKCDDWELLKSYYPAWAREVLVYPEHYGKFKKGKDVVDAWKDDAGRSWVFPASSMPEEAVGKTGVALFVDPQNVKIDGKRVIIETDPKSITIVTPFLQEDGWGRVDEKTRVPLALAPESSKFDAKRYLWRLGVSVRPLVRGWTDFGVFAYDGRLVNADCNWNPTFGFGVGSVGRIATGPGIEVAKATTEDGIVISSLSVEQFKAQQRQ